MINKPWILRPNDHDHFKPDHVARFLRNHNTGENNQGRTYLSHIIRSYEQPLKVLDSGGATAVNWAVFKNEGCNIEYTCLDRTQQFLDHAKQLYGDEINLIHGYVQELPFEDNTFSICILRHLIEHLPIHEAEMAISEIVRVASKEAILVLFLEPNMGLEHKVEERNSNIEGHPEITHYWTEYSWPKLEAFLKTLPVKEIKLSRISTAGAAHADYIIELIK